ncbi:MAG: GntR family transcriptional regulator [Nocardioidaceae bacterium]
MPQVGHRELAEILRAGIMAGDYPAGSTLPKQDEIAAEYGVNVKTVRSAVAILEAEGLVTPVRRRGTVVRQRPPMRRLGAERYAKSGGSTATWSPSPPIGKPPAAPGSPAVSPRTRSPATTDPRTLRARRSWMTSPARPDAAAGSSCSPCKVSNPST